MKFLKLFLVLVGFSYYGQVVASDDLLVVGDESNLVVPTNDDFKKINQAVEYYEAKIRLVEAQKAIRDAVSGSGSPGSAGRGDSSSIPRHLRGNSQGDSFIDGRGNKIEKKKEPVTFVNTVNGVGGNLSAEIVWGDRIVQVRSGDSALGGGWRVATVNKDDVVLVRRGTRVRIGSIPVKISSLME